MISLFSNIINSSLYSITSKYLLILLPIALPIILLIIFLSVRFRWLTMNYNYKLKPFILEIKLPKEILKSPAAMEIFFSYFAQRGAENLNEAFLDGRTRPCFSCEIVSTSGVVRFFIWCSDSKWKNLIETQLYAQYPNLEIFETEDYTKDFYFDPEKYPMFATQYALLKSDPFPIKTYIDYGLGLGEDQKEEYKIDPLTSVLEYMGSLKKGENAWIQILIQKHEKPTIFHGKSSVDKILKDEIKVEIEKIRKDAIPESDKKDEGTFKFPNPTKGQIAVISALERSSTKTPFECMIRSIYITEKDAFFPPNIGGLVAGVKQYASADLNGFRPDTVTEGDPIPRDFARVFPFYNKILEKNVLERKRDLLYAYKLRSYFQHPYKHYGRSRPFILTTEELATIFHFPSGMVSQTPTLQRVPSKKSEAPSNLPV